MPRLAAHLIAVTAVALAALLGIGLAAQPPQARAAASSGANVGGISAGQIDAYLASKGSPMTGQGSAFVASGGRWQVDPRLLVAIAGAESRFGQITCAPFNAWGWGCPDGPYRFTSWADGIDTVMEGLRTNYLSEGRTSVALIHQKYAPVAAANDPTGLNNYWTINVSRFVIELGGDPNDIDLNGVGGTIPLGPLPGGPPIEQFAFEEADGGSGRASTKDGAAATLEIATGAPRALVVRVRNTGSVAWRPEDVRLRRVDLESRVVGAPYGALTGGSAVPPDGTARFVVQLAAAGSSDGTAMTAWRLEGPSGPFGPEIERGVRFAVPAFVAGGGRAEVTAANGGVVPGVSAWQVVVRVQNAGSTTWTRDGSDGVLLGLRDVAGTVAAEGWLNDSVPARMLERTAAPGEQASFAFRVRGEAATLLVQPFRADAWAAGQPVEVQLGPGAPAAPRR